MPLWDVFLSRKKKSFKISLRIEAISEEAFVTAAF